MAWSAPMSEGFLLAATIASDRHAQLGRGGLGGAAGTSVATLVHELTSLDDTQRRQRIQMFSASMARPVGKPTVPMTPRALALLAPLAERNLARSWLAAAPTPRPGFRTEPGLRRVLLNLAEKGRWRG